MTITSPPTQAETSPRLPALTLRLFGYPQIVRNGTLVSSLESDKGRALLAYLAIEADRPHSRESLATLLWPDDSHQSGRQSLRQALYNLRQALAQTSAETPFLLTSWQNIQFNVESDYWLDVKAFEELLDAARSHAHRSMDACRECHERLSEAVALYRGEFLEGFSLPNAIAFDDWHRFQSDRLRNRLLDALNILAVYHERRREYEPANNYYQQSVEIDNLNEESQRGLIRTLALLGHQGSALRHYDLLRNILADELGAEPDEKTRALVEQIRGGEVQPHLLDSANPYKGLNAFGEKDAADFFGREAVIQDLVAAVERQPLVCVVGASGSGKSSAIQAGLIPHLRTQPAAHKEDGGYRGVSGRWSSLYFRPGPEPFLSLAEALTTLPQFAAAVDVLAAELRAGTVSLYEIATRAMTESQSTASAMNAGNSSEARLLIVIEQFEELFTLGAEAETRQAFINMLANTIRQSPDRSPHIVILLAMRSDFLGQLLSFPSLADLIQDSLFLLKPMSEAELRAAIMEPARNRGVSFETGLIERLIADAGLRVGNLSLLQFALTLLWEKQNRGELTHADYRQLGGVIGALASYADRVYQTLSPSDQTRARRVLLRMVQPGEGVPDTRRLTLRREFDDEDWQIVRKLADARLAITNHNAADLETAELAHEALIQDWGLMRAWLDEDRVFRNWQQRLGAALYQWEMSDHDDSALLRGVPLAEAESWQLERADDMNPSENAFIMAAIAQRNREQRETEAARALVLAQAQSLATIEHERAEVQAQSRRRLQVLSLILGVALIFGSVAAIIAVQRGREAIAAAELAEQQRQVALMRQLSAQASASQDGNLDLSLLLALESAHLASAPQDLADLFLGLDYSPLVATILHGEQSPIRNIALNDDDPNILIGGADGQVVLWDVAARKPITTMLETTPDGFANLSPDGRRAVTTDGVNLTLWELPSGRQLGQPLSEHPEDIDFVSFSKDGSRLVTGSKDGTLLLRDANDGHVLESFAYDGSGAMALSADGQRLAMYDDYDGRVGVEVWDLAQGDAVSGPYFGHEGGVESIEMSDDGSLLATAGADQTIRLWDGHTGEPVGEPLRGHSGRVLATGFSPDGRVLASGGADNTVRLWDVATGKPLGPPLTGHGNWVRDVLFSADGTTLFSADANGEVFIWDLAARTILRGHEDRVRGVALSDDETKLFTGGFEGNVNVWDTATGQLLQAWPDAHPAAIVTAITSPDRRWIASADVNGNVQLWDAHTLQPDGAAFHSAEPSFIIGLSFSPDGRVLATGDVDSKINLWDVASRQPLAPPFKAHESWVMALAFSPDGRTLASGGSSDFLVKLWDVEQLLAGNGEPLFEPLTGHTNWVTSLLFTSDGSTLLSASMDNTVRFWDTQTGTALPRQPLDQQAPIWSLLWYPSEEDRTLVTLGGDGTVIWWDVAAGAPAAPPLRTATETESMTMSSNGDILYIGAIEPIAQIWSGEQRRWQEQFCQIANRNLTPEEWTKNLGAAPYRETCEIK